jgi:DNA-binding MarR family transcriptional regulator
MEEFKMEDRDYELWLLLARTHYRVRQSRTHELRKYGLSPEQAGVLFFVYSSGNNAMPTQISRWMLREPQTITSIIDRMVRKGLINRVQDSKRRNVVRLSLTANGIQAYEQSMKREAFHEIMGSLSEGKRQILHEILIDIINAAREREKATREPPELV